MNQRNSSNVLIYLYLGAWDLVTSFGTNDPKEKTKKAVNLEPYLLFHKQDLFLTRFVRCVSCETWKHPKASQITHKRAKHPTNHPLISQKLYHFFPWRLFYAPQDFTCPSHARREMGAFFGVPPRFHILSSPMYDSLPSLIVDYNPSHKLLAQLHTLTKFLRRRGLAMLY